MKINRMLLLNLELIYDIPFGKDVYELKDIFDINIGLIEDKYQNLTQESREKVLFINLGAVKDDKTRSGTPLIDYEKRNQLNLNNVKKTEINFDENDKKPFVPDYKALTVNDYLISIRGRPKSVNLQSLNELSKIHPKTKFIASHHFIQIRPKALINDMYVPYLHLLLETVLDKIIINQFEEKKKEESVKGNKYSIYNSFSVKDFRELKVRITKDIDLQKKIYENFISNYNTCLKANLEFENFNNYLFSTFQK